MLVTRMKFRAIIPCQIEKIPTSNYFEKKNDNYFKKINICLKVNYIFKKFKKKILTECIIRDKVIVQCFGFCEELLATERNVEGNSCIKGNFSPTILRGAHPILNEPADRSRILS